jgi:hypothetical protein
MCEIQGVNLPQKLNFLTLTGNIPILKLLYENHNNFKSFRI